ncbi:MAG TPA: hypothetical protein VLU46_16875 [Thermoanaerobaculia bacterium]|nr:hypothetical protein [Thermoanaerobaculia bacterium]
MGIALWVVCGAAAFSAARAIAAGRAPAYAVEIVVAISVALVAGLVATVLDFGGWNEPDWRAGVFAVLCAFAAIGCVRLVRLLRRSAA